MDELIDFNPDNELEKAIVASRAGKMIMNDFLAIFVSSDIILPSQTEVNSDGSGLTPMMFDKNGTNMIAAFSSLERVPKMGMQIPFALKVNARWCLEKLSGKYGLVLNPGFTEGFDISPDGIFNILRDFH